jgi:membrane-bound serine protease (ClpP class)
MGYTRFILAWLIGLALCVPAMGQHVAPSKTVVISIEGEINEYTQHSLERRVEKAREMGAKTIVLQLDTPGGEVLATLHMTDFLRGLSDLHTIAYINTKAYSAGSMLAIACDEIYMADSATVGDCAPIAFHPATHDLVPLPATERAKASSPIVADFDASAAKNGYDTLLLRSFVWIGEGVYYLENDTGERKFVNQPEYAKLAGNGWHEVKGVPQPVNRSSQLLLTVNTDEAIRLGLAKGKASNLGALAKVKDLNIVGELNGTAGEVALDILSAPVARGFILVLFLVCMYIAFHIPGHGLPEVSALVLFCVLLGVPLLTGYANWWEVGLIVVGVLLIGLEVFVFPTIGAMAIGGVALMMIGLLLTFVAPEPGRSPLSMPKLPATWASLQNGLLVMVIGLTSAVFLCAWLRRFLPRLPYFNRLILNTVVGRSEGAMVGSLSNIDPSETGPAVGAAGVAVTDLRPGGSAQFKDRAGNVHVVSVVSDAGYVDSGEAIIVKSLQGPTIIVGLAGMAAGGGGLKETSRVGERRIEPLPVQIGEVGVAVSEMRPGGECEFAGRRLEAYSDHGIISAGTRVQVVSIDNRRPVVRAV